MINVCVAQPLIPKVITDITTTRVTSLEEDIGLFESNHHYLANIQDEDHTLSLKNSVVIHNQDKRAPQLQSEDMYLHTHFLCISIIRRINHFQSTCIYSKNNNGIWVINDAILLDYYLQLIGIKNLNSGDYTSEHYNCVVNAIQKFSPYFYELELLFKAPHALINKKGTASNKIEDDKISIAEIFNELHFNIYNSMNSIEFKEAIRTRVRRARSHFKRSEQYLTQLMQDHSRLLVIRIDLCTPSDMKNISIATLKLKFHRFLQKLRRHNSIKMRGYIWKLEYGFNKSYHYHLVIFLCGRQHTHDIKLAQMIGEIWDETIGGKNCYFNCNTNKHLDQYRTIVVGRLNANDHTKRASLLNIVIKYFCKKDQFILHKSIFNKKTFDTGRVKSIRKNLGRPKTV